MSARNWKAESMLTRKSSTKKAVDTTMKKLQEKSRNLTDTFLKDAE